MMSKIKLLIEFGLIVVIIAGCDLTAKERKHEKNLIQNYISSLGDTAYVKHASGVYYIELRAGTGRNPTVSDTVTFWYKAMFLDGTMFDSNYSSSSPYTAIIGTTNASYEIIPGIDEGVRYMKEGGKARLLIPSDLAFGAAGYATYDSYGNYYQIIPGYTPLLWVVELASVKAGPGK